MLRYQTDTAEYTRKAGTGMKNALLWSHAYYIELMMKETGVWNDSEDFDFIITPHYTPKSGNLIFL
jgi:hypothetical protein